MIAAMVLLTVAGGLATWLLLGLLVAVPVGRALARRDGRRPAPLRVTARGRLVALAAAAVLVAIAVALATRGQYAVPFGFAPLPDGPVLP